MFSAMVSLFLYLVLKDKFLPLHRVQVLISNNKLYDGYKPFSDKSIDRVCFINSGADLRNYGVAKNVDRYGYMAIVEYGGNSPKVGFAKESQLSHPFILTDGLSFCANSPASIVTKKRDIWYLTTGEK